MKELDKLYLYQSDVYYLERVNENCISIHTNEGYTIKIEGEFKITVTENTGEDDY